MRITLHIGVHKTGTTAIQYLLTRNKHLLRRHYIYYEPCPHQTNHADLAIAMQTSNPSRHDEARSMWRRFVSDSAASGCETLLLSSEELIGQRLDMGLMRELLRGHDPKVVAYVRSADELVLSAFNEVVRDSTHRWSRPANVEPFAYDPSFSLALQPWMDFLPPGQLIIAPYNEPQFYGESLFRDFLWMLGIQEATEFTQEMPQKDANISLAPCLVELLRQLNERGLDRLRHPHIVEVLRRFEEINQPLCLQASVSALSQLERRFVRSRTEANLENLRPYFRYGFNDAFLRASTLLELYEEKPSNISIERDLFVALLYFILGGSGPLSLQLPA